jgi:hypothetical protein
MLRTGAGIDLYGATSDRIMLCMQELEAIMPPSSTWPACLSWTSPLDRTERNIQILADIPPITRVTSVQILVNMGIEKQSSVTLKPSPEVLKLILYCLPCLRKWTPPPPKKSICTRVGGMIRRSDLRSGLFCSDDVSTFVPIFCQRVGEYL